MVQLGYMSMDTVLGDVPEDLPPANVQLGGSSNFLAAGDDHTCTLMEGGYVKCWGYGDRGQLGYGDFATVGGLLGTMPPPVVELNGTVTLIACGAWVQHSLLLPVTLVAHGGAHTCAQLSGGAVKCWGANFWGQLGYGHTNQIGDEPGEMPPPDVDTGGAARSISAGQFHTCALRRDGKVVCWGNALYGQCGSVAHLSNTSSFTAPNEEVRLSNQAIGDEPGEMPPPPVEISSLEVQQIGVGGHHGCALLPAGKVKCWGDNNYGQCGVGQDTHSRYIGLTEGDLPPDTVNLNSGAVQVVSAKDRTCAILDTMELECWGSDTHTSQDGYYVGETTWLQNVQQVNMGYYHYCAVYDDHYTRCWGRNDWAQLGAGDLDDIILAESFPPPVVNLGGEML
eukprot:gene14551-17199_t